MLKRFFTFLSIFLFSSILQPVTADANCDEQEKEILRLKDEISQMKIEQKMMQETISDDRKNSSDFSKQFLTNSRWTARSSKDDYLDDEPNCIALENEFSQFHIIIEESRKKNERLTEVIDNLLSYVSENMKPKDDVNEEEFHFDEDDQDEDLDAKERNLNMFDGLDGSENEDELDEEDFEFVVESQGSGNSYPNDDVESLPKDKVVLEDELDQCQVELSTEKEEFEQLKDNCTVEIKLLKHELKKVDITKEIPRDCRKMLEVQKLSHELIELSEEFEMKNELVHHLEQQIKEVHHEEQEINKEGKNSIVVNYELKEEIDDLKIHNEVLKMGLVMSKSDLLADTKSAQIISISSELKRSAKEIQARKKLDEIDKLIARRGSNLRRNSQLKKNVEQKLKDMRRVDHSAVVGILQDFIDLYIDNDVALKKRDKLIEEVVKDLETILNQKNDVKRRSRSFDNELTQEKFKRRFEESSKTAAEKQTKKLRKSSESFKKTSLNENSKKSSSLDSRGLWKSTNRILGRSKRFVRTSGISERSRVLSERKLMKDFKKLQQSGRIPESSAKVPVDLQSILDHSEKSLKRALHDFYENSENFTLRRSEERIQRRLEKDENHNQITEKIIKLNILLDKQHEAMKIYNKEMNETFERMFPENSTQSENFVDLKSKVQALRRKIKQKDTILKEKYETLERSVGEIEDIRNDEERTKGLLGEAESSLEGAMHDEDDGGGSDLTSILHDEVTNTCGNVVERNSALKTGKDSDLQKIKDLESEHNDWVLKAHKCKCFYKSWFNKKCKF